jgi:hypothetical protein
MPLVINEGIAMHPRQMSEDLLDDEVDFEDADYADGEDWDEEALGLDGADIDTDSIAREIGVRP